MQQSNQEIYPYQNDEIDLREIFFSFVKRKFIIFGITAFITLLAIIYALNVEPTYKAVSSFTSPSDSAMMNLNKIFSIESNETYELNELNELIKVVTSSQLENIVFEKNSVFSNFLTTLASKEFQKKVFIDGDYLTAFNPNDEPIDDVNKFISQSLKSIELSPPALTDRDLKFSFLTELPYSISIEGKDPVVISNYLNNLVAAVDDSTVNELTNLIKQEISIRLDQISIERELLLAKEKQKRINEIKVLTDAAIMANSLGIKENNFDQVAGDKINSNLIVALGENHPLPGATQSLPIWYLYGERAILERVNVLETRISDEPFILELMDLDNEKLKLESSLIGVFLAELVELDNEKLKLESSLSLIDTIGFNTMQLSQAAITPIIPIKPNKRLIVLLAFIVGFIFSIFVVLVMNVLEPNEKNST